MFEVLTPPADETKFAELGKEILAAGAKLGMTLEPEGFLFSWTSGTRIVVERDNTSKEIIGMGIVSVGRRWIANDFSATILEFRGEKKQPLFDFIVQICKAQGATVLFFEPDAPREIDGKLVHIVVEYPLQ